jgi:hypothetical protein
MSENKEDFEKLRIEQEQKAREGLNEDGISGLLVFTLENFAYRYLESEGRKDIKATKVKDSHFLVEGSEKDPLVALKVSNPIAKKGVVSLAKSYSSTKGVGLEVRSSIEARLISDNEIECISRINWNQSGGFSLEEDKAVSKSVRFKFDDPLLLRNKLALLLEEVCEIF